MLGEITDDLLYHGDLNAALRRLMQSGLPHPHGERMRASGRCWRTCGASAGTSSSATTWAASTTTSPRSCARSSRPSARPLDDRLDEAAQSGDARQRELTQQVVAERQMQLDMLPPDLAGQVKELQNYDFVSQEAQQRFEELVDKLRQQIMQSQLNQMAGAMENMGPEQMQRMKDMLSELNNMLDQKNRGENTDQSFRQFMERYGDFFPENPQNLDELLEQMAEKHGGHAQAMLNSMTPEQRAQLQGLIGPAARGHGPALAARPARLQPAPGLPRPAAGSATTTSAARTRSTSPRPTS